MSTTWHGTHRFVTTAVGAVLLAGAALALTSLNSTTSPVASADSSAIAVESLTGFSGFTDDVSLKFKRKLAGQEVEVLNLPDSNRMLVARITVPPGAQFPWHTHPGPVVVHVVEGALVYQQASDCVERHYRAAEAFLDPGTEVHTAWNPSEHDAAVLVAVFHGVAEGAAPTIPESDQDNRCP